MNRKVYLNYFSNTLVYNRLEYFLLQLTYHMAAYELEQDSESQSRLFQNITELRQLN